jgi:hypothetical protein
LQKQIWREYQVCVSGCIKFPFHSEGSPKLFSTLLGRGLFSIGEGLSSISCEPFFLTLTNGDIIPYPRGSESEVKAETVIEYGEHAVAQFLPETNNWNKLKNVARLRYLEMRKDLLHSFRGKWVAVNPAGNCVVAPTEEKVIQMAELLFPFRVDEYFVECVGCEIMMGAVMDSSISEGTRSTTQALA